MMASLPLSSLLLDPQLPIRGLKPGAKLVVEQGAAGEGRSPPRRGDARRAGRRGGVGVGPGALLDEAAALEHDGWSRALSPGGCMTGASLVATLATTLGINRQRIVAT
jgi:hypothetical protein